MFLTVRIINTVFFFSVLPALFHCASLTASPSVFFNSSLCWILALLSMIASYRTLKRWWEYQSWHREGAFTQAINSLTVMHKHTASNHQSATDQWLRFVCLHVFIFLRTNKLFTSAALNKPLSHTTAPYLVLDTFYFKVCLCARFSLCVDSVYGLQSSLIMAVLEVKVKTVNGRLIISITSYSLSGFCCRERISHSLTHFRITAFVYVSTIQQSFSFHSFFPDSCNVICSLAEQMEIMVPVLSFARRLRHWILAKKKFLFKILLQWK